MRRPTSPVRGVTRGKGAAACVLPALVLIACLLLPGSAAAAPGPHDAASAARKKHPRALRQRPAYWGAWIDNRLTGGQPPWDMSAVNAFEQRVSGKGLSLVEFSAPFYDCGRSPCAPLPFPAKEMNAIRNYGAIPLISWGSDSIPVPEPPALPNQPDFELRDIAAGTYDGYIREFAEAARNWGSGFFLRFNHEMNGDWFPWGATVNGAQPGDYVAAWRHVHDIFTQVGATNATWVWCPYVEVKRKFAALHVDGLCFRSMNSASSAERLSADETIKTRLPMMSISRLNANGAAACAIRAGAPMMPSR